MTRHRARLEDTLPQPWRNGGGSTWELLAWPQAAPWQVRVSVAEIARDGPFSAFPGVDRWFAVLEGAGVVLALPQGERLQAPADAPLRFDGEAAPACRLVHGPTLDLNLMVERGGGSGAMRRATPGEPLAEATRWRAVFAGEDLLVDCDDVTERVAAGELLWSDDCGDACWRLRSAALAWFMALR